MNYNLFHVDGLRFELLSDEEKNREYDVEFRNNRDNEKIYITKMKPNTWASLNMKYLSDISILINHSGRRITEINCINYIRGKNVFINLESKALGDTLAWIPYCEEFRKFYQCNVIVSTFHNYLFENVYKSLKFVGRGIVVNDLAAMFNLGWFFDKNKEPVPPQTIPLQKAATNILNLPYREIIPEIDFSPSEKPIQGKYVAISTQSTAALKFWDYWQDLIDMLVARGYKVVEVSKDKTDYKNVEYVQDKSIPNVMNLIYHSDFYIGLSSGLSWLSWALHKRVYMIANFSLADHEFTTNCIRITDTSICHGCWNNPLFKFNRGDNLWCPEHEDTPQAFECHKKINAAKVMKTIELNENL